MPIPRTAGAAVSDPESTGPIEPVDQLSELRLTRQAVRGAPALGTVRTATSDRVWWRRRDPRSLAPALVSFMIIACRAMTRGRTRSRWWDPVLLLPAVVSFTIIAWDLGKPSYWRDEAATLDADGRSLPALSRMLTHVDAVHGGYYLLMWPIVHTLGTGEIALRLPSALAMAAAATGLAALGRRLHSARAGLFAGLVFAVLPQVSRYGQEARSYAFVVACATLASYLLVRALDEPGRRWLFGYGAAIAVLGVLNLCGLLLLAGHAIFVLARARVLTLRWLGVAAVSALPSLPIAVLAWQQRDQLGWVSAPEASAPGDLTVWLAGSAGSVVLVSFVIGLGLRDRTGVTAAWLALPWLVAPPVLLLSASEVAMPVYVQRYVAYCLPALALPVGVGLAGIALAPRVTTLLLIAGLGMSTQLAQRQVGGHGDDIRAVASVLAQHEHAGDGVLYDCPTCHYQDMPREFAFAYPSAFRRLDDLALAASPSASGTLRGTETDPATLTRRIDGTSRVWLVETGGASVPTPLADSDLHLIRVYPAGGIRVALYAR